VAPVAADFGISAFGVARVLEAITLKYAVKSAYFGFQVKAQIAQIKNVSAGFSVSCGHTIYNHESYSSCHRSNWMMATADNN